MVQIDFSSFPIDLLAEILGRLDEEDRFVNLSSTSTFFRGLAFRSPLASLHLFDEDGAFVIGKFILKKFDEVLLSLSVDEISRNGEVDEELAEDYFVRRFHSVFFDEPSNPFRESFELFKSIQTIFYSSSQKYSRYFVLWRLLASLCPNVTSFVDVEAEPSKSTHSILPSSITFTVSNNLDLQKIMNTDVSSAFIKFRRLKHLDFKGASWIQGLDSLRGLESLTYSIGMSRGAPVIPEPVLNSGKFINAFSSAINLKSLSINYFGFDLSALTSLEELAVSLWHSRDLSFFSKLQSLSLKILKLKTSSFILPDLSSFRSLTDLSMLNEVEPPPSYYSSIPNLKRLYLAEVNLPNQIQPIINISHLQELEVGNLMSFYEPEPENFLALFTSRNIGSLKIESLSYDLIPRKLPRTISNFNSVSLGFRESTLVKTQPNFVKSLLSGLVRSFIPDNLTSLTLHGLVCSSFIEISLLVNLKALELKRLVILGDVDDSLLYSLFHLKSLKALTLKKASSDSSKRSISRSEFFTESGVNELLITLKDLKDFRLNRFSDLGVDIILSIEHAFKSRFQVFKIKEET